MHMPAPPSGRPAPTEFAVILNASSGRKSAPDEKSRLERLFGADARRVTILAVAKGSELPAAIARAVEDGHRVLVAAGGDGTIAAVAEAAVAHGRVLGVLPMGTFNFVARGFGIPEDPAEAAALLVSGRERPVPVAEVNGRLFLNNASLGLYPAILREREGIYRRWGRSRIAAHWSVVRTVLGLARPLWLGVIVDGETLRTRTPLLFVARSAFQLERYGLDGAEAVRSGRFALFLAPDAPPLRLMLIAFRLVVGGIRPGRDLGLVECDEIDVQTSSRDILVAHDGERSVLPTPLKFRIRRDALKVIVPETTEATS